MKVLKDLKRSLHYELSENLDMIYKYLLTIRKHQVLDQISELDIDEVIDYLKAKLKSINIVHQCYEIDKTYNQLHYHAVVTLVHKVWYKDNSKYKGFRIHWSPIGNLCGAIQYVLKEASNKYEQEQILIKNYYCNHYGFIDPTSEIIL